MPHGSFDSTPLSRKLERRIAIDAEPIVQDFPRAIQRVEVARDGSYDEIFGLGGVDFIAAQVSAAGHPEPGSALIRGDHVVAGEARVANRYQEGRVSEGFRELAQISEVGKRVPFRCSGTCVQIPVLLEARGFEPRTLRCGVVVQPAESWRLISNLARGLQKNDRGDAGGQERRSYEP